MYEEKRCLNKEIIDAVANVIRQGEEESVRKTIEIEV
jgi:hypothetical protein